MFLAPTVCGRFACNITHEVEVARRKASVGVPALNSLNELSLDQSESYYVRWLCMV